MKHPHAPTLHAMVQRQRTREGCEVLNIKGIDEFGQQWEQVVLRSPSLKLELKSSERVYTHTPQRIRSAG